jgi:penicillin-binding protein 2
MSEKDSFHSRQYIIRGFFILVAVLLASKSFQIQIIDSSYAEKARSVVVSDLTVYPSRGLIYDRSGKLLVANTAMYDLMVIYNLVGDMDTAKFCNLLNISKEDFENILDKDYRNDDRFDKKVPFPFLKKISMQSYAAFQESMYEFPGFFVQIRNVRTYPYHSGAHVLGYINEVTPNQIEKYEGEYARGDYIGAKGLESQYEKQLRGIEGSWMDGKQDVLPESGLDLVTTLDIDLQVYAEKLMRNKRGAIVAIEPKTGEILTMVSAPTYDPNLLTMNRERGLAFSYLVQDSLRPLYDRSLMAMYPPGSIFKSVISLVGMQTGVWNKERGFGCNGGYNYGGSRPLGCHGHVYPNNVTTALQHSCNAYYCQLFRDVVDQYD